MFATNRARLTVRPRTTRNACLVLALALLWLPGCESTPDADDYLEMSEADKARRIKVLRDKAERHRVAWVSSLNNPDGPDLQAMEEFTRLHRETTLVYPSPGDCPRCYLNYAMGLRSQGIYYDVLYKKQAQVLERSKGPEEARELREKIAANRELAHRFFRQSVQQFETYLSSGQEPPDSVYEFLSQQCAELGDYRRGMLYLERFMNSRQFSDEDMAVLEKRHRLFKREYERQLIEDVDKDLGR